MQAEQKIVWSAAIGKHLIKFKGGGEVKVTYIYETSSTPS